MNSIRAYPELKRKHNEAMDTLGAVNMDGMPHGSSVGRSTEAAALHTGLTKAEQREYEAVRLAVEWTYMQPWGGAKVKLIDLLYWRKKWKRISDAAQEVHLSDASAFRFHREFVTMVGNYITK